MIRITLSLLFCAIAYTFQAQSIGGIDPTTLTNSDIKKLGFGSADLQSLKNEVKVPNEKIKPKVTDTVVDFEDTYKTPKSTAIQNDSVLLAEKEIERFNSFRQKAKKYYKSLSKKEQSGLGLIALFCLNFYSTSLL